MSLGNPKNSEFDEFFSSERFIDKSKIRTILEIYANTAKNVIVSETLAGRFANGENRKYPGSARKRLYAKRGNKVNPHSDSFVGYKGFRLAKGLQVGFVDFFASGKTLRSVQTQVSPEQFSFELSLKGRAALLTRGNKSLYDWFSFGGGRTKIISDQASAIVRKRGIAS